MPEEVRKHKIFWSDEEKALLCSEAARQLYSLNASSKLAALNQAQEAKLPSHRRRSIVALTSLTWFTEGIQRELDALRAAVLQEAATPPTPVHPDPQTMGLEQLYPLLRRRLVSELASFISDVLQEVKWPAAMQQPETAAVVGTSLLRTVLSPPPAGPRLPSVLVVGLRGGQMEEVRRDFSKRLDLRFFGSDENKEKLRSMCEQTDVSIAMTDFISHSHEDILSKRAKRYVRSAGGLTRLKDVLRSIETEPVLAAA